MNQWMYDTMVAIIQNGAPALANQLIEGLQSLIKDYQEKSKRVEELEKEIENMKKTDTPMPALGKDDIEEMKERKARKKLLED